MRDRVYVVSLPSAYECPPPLWADYIGKHVAGLDSYVVAGFSCHPSAAIRIMAEFLTTSGISYHLEELIKSAQTYLTLISPYLKLNDRIKDLLADKNRLKIDVRIIYGKNDLQPEENNWLKELEYVRTSFCKNLHAKCYISEDTCIISSLNLYEFSQVNNNEMGVLISRKVDGRLYDDAYAEAQRLFRISEEHRISVETVPKSASDSSPESASDDGKLTTSKLAKKLGLKTAELSEKLIANGYLEMIEDKPHLTDKGKAEGGEFRMSKRFGPFFVWPETLSP
jgi:phosphatidylserine/phosphatidylglycerophosphate/cardiolipin synthase-like enzyme